MRHPQPAPPDDLLEPTPSAVALHRTTDSAFAGDESHTRHLTGQRQRQQQTAAPAERGTAAAHRGEISATPHAMLRREAFVMGRDHLGPPKGRHASGMRQAGGSAACSAEGSRADGPGFTQRRGRGVRPISRTTRTDACDPVHDGHSELCDRPWSSSASESRASSSCADCWAGKCASWFETSRLERVRVDIERGRLRACQPWRQAGRGGGREPAEGAACCHWLLIRIIAPRTRLPPQPGSATGRYPPHVTGEPDFHPMRSLVL